MWLTIQNMWYSDLSHIQRYAILTPTLFFILLHRGGNLGVWWKGQPAVNWENCNGRCRLSTRLHFSTVQRQAHCTFLDWHRPLHFSTGWRRPRKVQWWKSTALFMTNCMEKILQLNALFSVDVDHTALF